MREWFRRQPSWVQWLMLIALAGAIQGPFGGLEIWLLGLAVSNKDARDFGVVGAILLSMVLVIILAIRLTPSSTNQTKVINGSVDTPTPADQPVHQFLPTAETALASAQPEAVPLSDHQRLQAEHDQLRGEYQEAQAELIELRADRHRTAAQFEARLAEQEAQARAEIESLTQSHQTAMASLKRTYEKWLPIVTKGSTLVEVGEQLLDSMSRSEPAPTRQTFDVWRSDVSMVLGKYQEMGMFRRSLVHRGHTLGGEPPPPEWWDQSQMGDYYTQLHQMQAEIDRLRDIIRTIQMELERAPKDWGLVE